VALLKPVVGSVTGLGANEVAGGLSLAIAPLRWVVPASGIFLLLLGLLIWLRHRLLRGREVALSGTWDCGYARPTGRMQYTASSFAQPLTTMFGFLLRTRRRFEAPVGFFPAHSALHTETDDLFQQNLFRPALRGIERLLVWLHWLQQGRVQLYILYVAVTLLVLLVWNLR
jgi:hypothetical protein